MGLPPARRLPAAFAIHHRTEKHGDHLMYRSTSGDATTLPDLSFATAIVESAARRGDPVVVDHDGAYTGTAFADLTRRLARALARHGVGPENRLALVVPTTGEALAVRYAAALLGAASAVAPVGAAPAEVTHLVDAVGADLLVTDTTAAATCRAARHGGAIRLVFGLGPADGADIDLREDATHEPPSPIGDRSVPSAPAVLTGSRNYTFRDWAERSEVGSADHPLLGADHTLLAGGCVIFA